MNPPPYWWSTVGERDPFTFESVYRFPEEELDARTRSSGSARVAVIGGGISGLVSALELSERGFEVEIFEAGSRTGGRVRTHRFANGFSAELGAMRIPSSHACTLHYVDRFKIEKRRFVNYNGRGFYKLRGELSHIADWRSAASSYDLRKSERRDPSRLLELQMSMAMARLSAKEKYQLFFANTPGIVEEYDFRTLRQHLESNFLSREAIEYLGHASGLIQYERASFLETLIDYFGLLRVDQFELVGGMDTLTSAMDAELGQRIHLESRVRSVAVEPHGVELVVETERGLAHHSFDYVICTAPARESALIDWLPVLDDQKINALRRLYYASAAKTVVSVNRRVWETNQGIYGGGSFSDEPFQQMWYPSDNARPDSETPPLAMITGDDSDLTATSSAPSRWLARNDEVSRGPGAFTASYTWENNARLMASLSETERTDLVLRSAEALHPGIGQHVEDVKHVVWDAEQGTGGGAFAYFAPGEHSRYLEALQAPHPHDIPRVFFAGEHVSVVHAWMQGSIQSALEAVLSLMDFDRVYR